MPDGSYFTGINPPTINDTDTVEALLGLLCVGAPAVLIRLTNARRRLYTSPSRIMRARVHTFDAAQRISAQGNEADPAEPACVLRRPLSPEEELRGRVGFGLCGRMSDRWSQPMKRLTRCRPGYVRIEARGDMTRTEVNCGGNVSVRVRRR